MYVLRKVLPVISNPGHKLKPLGNHIVLESHVDFQSICPVDALARDWYVLDSKKIVGVHVDESYHVHDYDINDPANRKEALAAKESPITEEEKIAEDLEEEKPRRRIRLP